MADDLLPSPGEIRKLFDAVRDLTTQNTRLVAIVREVILKRYADMGEIVASLPGRLELLETAVREGSDDEANAIRALAGQVRRLEELELLRQVGRDNSDRADRLRGDIRSEHDVEHLQNLLIEVTKNLDTLEIREARYGGNAPIELVRQLEELKARREKINAELKELRR